MDLEVFMQSIGHRRVIQTHTELVVVTDRRKDVKPNDVNFIMEKFMKTSTNKSAASRARHLYHAVL